MVGSSIGGAGLFSSWISIAREERKSTDNKLIIALGGVVLALTGMVILERTYSTKRKVKNEFINDYDSKNFGKIESQLKLKTKGSGIGLTYSFKNQ